MIAVGSDAFCRECGSPLEPGRRCLEYFHDLLALEAHAPGGPGELPHFYAVASYNLQHPLAFTADALAGLRAGVHDVLAGHVTLGEHRRRTRRTTGGPTRVLRDGWRGPADPGPAAVDAWPEHWPRTWPMTVRDVCATEPADYARMAQAWAASVTATLDAALGPSSSSSVSGAD